MTQLKDPLNLAAHPHEQRIAKLVDAIDRAGSDGLLISRDCDIRYLTGFCGHDSWLVVSPTAAVVISDNRYDEQLDPVRDAGHAEVIIGVRHRLVETLPDLCSAHTISRMGLQADHVTLSTSESIRAYLSGYGVTVVATSGLVEAQRMCKDEFEITLIERAIEVNETALAATLEQVSPGMTEREVGALLEYEMKRRGAEAVGFVPIIASGAHGSLPHFETSDAPVKSGSSLLIDWGARVDGYNADLTRTFGIGSVPAKISEIYAIVLDAQLKAIDAIMPGRSCAEIDKIARDHITDAGYGDAFGHGLGHGLGLEVHEAPYFNHLQTDVALKPGMVMTVEPGIYLPGVGGVRIEDDVVVTEQGCRVLSAAPKSLEDAVIF